MNPLQKKYQKIELKAGAHKHTGSVKRFTTEHSEIDFHE